MITRKELCALLVLGTMLMTAREVSADVTWGLKGGLALATIRVTSPGGFAPSADAGGTAGVFAGVDLGEAVRFQPELLVTKSRFSAEDLVPAVAVSSTSVDVPLLFQWRSPERRRARVMLYAGPRLAVVGQVSQTVAQSTADISDQIKNLDAGVAVGGGVEVAAGRGAVILDARINVGLRNLNEAADGSIKSRAFLALVGYRF